MNAMAALKQYQTVNTQAQAMEASPHRLIQMLMEGGLTRLAQARGAMERERDCYSDEGFEQEACRRETQRLRERLLEVR